MFGTKLKIAAGVAVGAFLSGGLAFAAIPSEDGTITACYTRNPGLLNPQGSLRVVDSASQCRSNETALTWNQQGQPGPQGATGPQGPQGAPGTPAGITTYANEGETQIPPHDIGGLTLYCDPGDIATGGGFDVKTPDLLIHESHPDVAQPGQAPHGWTATAANPTDAAKSFSGFVVCLDVA